MATNIQARRSQRERTRTTTGALIAAARELFVADGFSATSLDAICARAGVTRGAFYHHFKNKEAVFQEVYAADQKKLATVVQMAFRAEPDPWEGIAAGCRALLAASLEPSMHKITLIEAPGALGWSTMRGIQADCKKQVRRGLALAIEAGCIPDQPLEPLTSLLSGGIGELALDLADATNQHTALDDAIAVLDVVLTGLAGNHNKRCAHKRQSET